MRVSTEPTPPASKPTRRHVVGVQDLRRRLGERHTVEVAYQLEVMEVIASRTAPDPVTGVITFESIERGVSVMGDVRFSWIGDCRRCLDPVTGETSADIFEIFQVDAPDDSEINELINDAVDLVPLVRDVVLLGLPLAPLCGDDCAGPDPDRYPAKTEADLEAEAAAAGPVTDPRWAALDGLDLGDS